MGTRLFRWAAALGLATGLATGLMLGSASVAEAADSAVVIMYHRFGENTIPSTNVRIEQLDAHIAELTSGRYKVLPLAEIAEALAEGKPLPDRAIGISVDDAYKSFLTQAWPRFKKAGLPVTLFVATEPVDGPIKGYLNWDEIKQLAAEGVTIGAHSTTHPHLPDLPIERVRKEIEASNARFKEKLGAVPTLFSYPFGEASLAVVEEAKRAGYRVAFGQHSGVAQAGRDRYYLPRFAMNETWGAPDRLKTILNALPVPFADRTPEEMLVSAPNPPPFGFTVNEPVGRLDNLRCYASHEANTRIERLGESRIEVRMSKPLTPGRTRLNCTMPGPDGRWRWLGWQFYIKGGKN